MAAGYYVDNQKECYEYLKKNNYIVGLGNLPDTDKCSFIDTKTDYTQSISDKIIFLEYRYIDIFKKL